MKIFIKSLLILSIPALIFFVFQCGSDEPVAPKQLSERNVSKDDPLPCCNWNNPNVTGCYGPYYSLWCQGRDHSVTCECCKALWNLYGSTPEGYLNYYGPPCPGDLHFICDEIGNREP